MILFYIDGGNMSGSRLKYGIIGCGGIAGAKHLPALAKIRDLEVTAFCDIIRTKAEDANVRFSGGRGKVFEDYRELINEDLDAKGS